MGKLKVIKCAKPAKKTPPFGSTGHPPTAKVDEDGLKIHNGDQNRPGETNGGGSALGSGTTVVNFGSFVPPNLAGAVQFNLAALANSLHTSDGGVVTFAVEAGTGDLVGKYAGAEVIRVHVSTVGAVNNGAVTYKFDTTLSQAIQHSQSGVEDINTWQVPFTVKASNNQVSAPINFAVAIVDDTPTVSANTLVQLDDDALTGGNPGGTGDDLNSVNATGTLAHSYGADGAGTTLLLGTGAPAGFTYTPSDGGKTLTIKQDSTGLNVVQITLSNTADGSYTVTQLNAIDHPVTGTEDNLSFAVNYQVTDHDGDTVNGSLTLDVDDDTPTVSANTLVQLDDDALTGGNPGGTGDDLNSVNATGTLAHSYGADGAGTTLLLGTGAPAGFTYTPSDGGKTLTIKQDSTGLNVVQITLSNTADGSYTVTQLNAIDHPVTGTEDNLSFAVNYQVTDHDGDTVNGSLTLDVDDDTPTVSANTLVQLDDDALTGGNPGGTGDDLNSVNATGTLAHSYGADGAGTTLLLGTGAPAGFTYTPSDGGKTLTIKQDSTGLNVLQITLSNTADGSYTVTQLNAIDHPVTGTEDNLSFAVNYQVTDHDGDTVNGSLTLDVDDDTPTVSANTLVQLDDDALTGGNPGGTGDDLNSVNATGTLAHSYGADGAGTTLLLGTGAPAGFTYTPSDGGKTLTIKQDSTGLNVVQITLSNTADGSYTVTQLNAIDHPVTGTEDNLSFAVNYQVTDHDGDTVNGSLTLDVDDDTPTVSANTLVQLDDDALTGGNPGGTGDDLNSVNATGTLAHSYGADGAGTTLLLGTGAPAGFTYTPSDGGKTLTIKQDSTGLNVVQITLSNTADGSYTVTQLNAIDHPVTGTEDNLSFAVNYQVTDHDGDTVNGSLTLDVDDDTPTVSANTLVQLDDDALTGGNPGGTGDDLNSVNATGTLAHSYGADGAGTTLLLGTGAPAGFTYTPSDGGKTLTIKQDSTGLNVVQITLSNTADGSYTVTQLNAIDHPVTGTEDNLSFAVNYQVTDHDGDTVNGSLTLDVDDDTPTVSANTLVQLDDDALTGGNPGGTGDDLNSVNATGTLAHSYGADGAGTTLLLGTGAPAGFTYTPSDGGKTLTIKQDSTGLNVVQITLSNTADGSYTVTQLNAIDHPVTGTEDNLSFAVNYQVTDHDGDTVNGSLTLDVDDDTPTVSANTLVQLDDDALTGGNPGGTGDDLNSVNATGTLAHSYGADGAGTTLLLGTGAPAGFTYTPSDGGKTLTIKQDSTGLNVVQITLSNTADGSYTVTQLNAIDHPVTGTEDNLSFAVNYQVTDHDGDTVNGSLTLDVDDDTPTVSANTLVQLDDDALTGGNPGGTGDDLNSVNATGTLAHSYGADGAGTTLLLGTGAPAGFTYTPSDGGKTLTIKQDSTGLNVVQITLSNTADGSYTVTQLNAIDHPVTGTEDNLSFAVNYQVTDHDGDTVNGSLTLDVDDDTPTVSANTLVQLDDDALTGGNPGGTGDDLNSVNATGTLAHSYGADGAGTTLLLGTGAPAGFTYTPSDGGKTLTIKQDSTGLNVVQITLSNTADGSYTVTQLNAIDHPVTGTEDNLSFAVNYQVTDHDGDTVNGSLTLDVDDDTPTVSANTLVQLDDDALTGGNPGGTGDDLNSVNATGTLAHSYGADGAGTTLLLGTGAPAGFTYTPSDGGKTLTIKQDSTGLNVVQITLSNTADGSYTVTQLNAIDHPVTGTEDNLSFAVNYQVTDHDGDTVNGSLTLDVDDDTPTVSNNAAQASPNQAGAKLDMLVVFDASGSMFDNAVSGVPSNFGFGNLRIDLARFALLDLVNQANVDEVKIVQFGSDATSTVWMSKANAISYVLDASNFPNAGSTDYDAALRVAKNAFLTPPVTADQRLVHFLSDGEPNQDDSTGSIGIDETDTNNPGFGGIGEETNWINFLAANGVLKSSAFGIGGLTVANANNLEPIAWQSPEVAVTFPTAALDSNVTIISDNDLASLGSTLVSAVPGSTSGNVLADGTPDSYGADGGRILSIQIGGTVYTWNGLVGAGARIDLGTPGNLGDDLVASAITNIPTPQGGKLTFDFATGAWTYTTPTTVTGATPDEVFTYAVVDRDGDVSAPATLTIDLVPIGDAPQIYTSPGGLIPYWTTDVSNSSQTFINRVSFFDNDNPANVRVTFTSPNISDAFSATTGGDVTVGGGGTSTITLDGTIADINAFLKANLLSWNPAGDGSPISENQADRTLTVTIDDNGTNPAGNVISKNLILDHDTHSFSSNSDNVNFASWNLNQAAPRGRLVNADIQAGDTGGSNNNQFGFTFTSSAVAGLSITQISINVTGIGTFDQTGADGKVLTVGSLSTVLAGDISTVTLGDTTNLVITFAPGAFTVGDVLRFGIDTDSGAATLASGGNFGDESVPFTVTFSDGAVLSNFVDGPGNGSNDTSVGTAEIVDTSVINTLGGTDNVVTSWSHGPSTGDVVYNGGGSSGDTVTLVFTPSQLEGILSGASATALDAYLDGSIATADTLDLGSTSWNATVTGFGNAALALAAGHTQHVVYSAIGTTDADLPTIDLTPDNDAAGDTVVGSGVGELLKGGVNADDIDNNGNDILVSLGGADTLWGGGGGDLLLAGDGNDHLHGGNGVDVLSGGRGADVFYFSATDANSDGVPTTNADFIVDYSLLEGDKIDLSLLLNPTFGGGGGSNVSDYVRVIETPGDSTSLTVQVDVNGTLGGSTWSDVAVLSGYLQTSADAVKIAFNSLGYVINRTGLAATVADPIVLDLGQHGLSFTSLTHGVQFDINADGLLDQVAWTAGTDGILTYDIDNSGTIENGTEVFTPHFAGGQYADGLAALASLDSNQDGLIDASDAAFDKLAVWQDTNHDGISDTAELSSLTDFGITTINLDATAANGNIDGQALQTQGSFAYADGTTGTFVEVALETALGAATISGTDGNDTLAGGAGNDTLDGGDGIDTATYIDASSSVTVNLATGTAMGVDGNDALRSIENVIGSHFDDSLTGDSNANVLSGGSGADTFHIGASFGHDTITDYLADPNGDALDFSSAVFTDATAVLNAATDDGQGNVLITVDADNTIVLSGVSLTDLQANQDHFHFVWDVAC